MTLGLRVLLLVSIYPTTPIQFKFHLTNLFFRFFYPIIVETLRAHLLRSYDQCRSSEQFYLDLVYKFIWEYSINS